MLSPSLLTAAVPVCTAILLALLVLALLAGVLWLAHRREVAVLERRANLLQTEAAASRERLRTWLSGAAHALSQPLTTLNGTLELALLSKAFPAEARPALEDALQHVQSATNMIRLLRELADAEMSGASAQAISLARLFDGCHEDLEKLAQARDVRLLLRCEVASQVFASTADLRRAIHYLVEHVLERSPAGGLVQITCAQEANAASIMIRDEGPTIPAQDRAHWFEPFYSGHAGAVSTQDALRLAVVEHICASCRGNASVESDGTGGACFILRLPRT